MPKPLTVVIPHTLGVAEARRRLDEGLVKLGKDLPGGLTDLTQTWDGDTMSFSAGVMGNQISGMIEVLADQVMLAIVLPGLLGMLAGKIGRKVEEQGQLLLK